MLVLGIETSCDETACGIVDARDMTVLSNPLYSQLEEHAPHGGVVPEVAARAHLQKIGHIVEQALQEAKCTPGDLQMIAFTRGPGLMGPLLVGACFARGLALDLKIPAIGVNHLEGHIAAAHLSYPDLCPPYVALTVSGGHTELTLVQREFIFTCLGRTRDDAAGEAFDKCGKLLGLSYPAGALVSKLAKDGDPTRVRFPRALQSESTGDFSFSGLKTAVARHIQETGNRLPQEKANICASLQEAIVDILVQKSMRALELTKVNTLVLGGGVSANNALREGLAHACKLKGIGFAAPQAQYCTDNGAMIAAAAIMREKSGQRNTTLTVQPWLPLVAPS